MKQWVQLQDFKDPLRRGTKHTCVRFRTTHKCKKYTVFKICELPVTNHLHSHGSPGIYENIINSREF
jgi:hypothetical protein